MSDQQAPAAPAPVTPGVGARIAGMLNIFVDPKSAAELIPLPWSWLWPLAATSLVIALTSWVNIPIVLQVMQRNPPRGMSPEALDKALPMITMTQKIAAAASPVIVMAMLALFSAVLMGACVVVEIRAKFRDHFSLLANASLIGALQQVAGFIVVRLKGSEIQSIRELRPAFGFDLLLPPDANKLLAAVAGYFSLFTIWYIVMLALTFAHQHGVSKGKAFAVTSPVWVLAMIFAVIGTLVGG